MSAANELILDGTAPPTGRVSIEASAGTGKTYSLTQLVVLHVIHFGLSPDQVLLVTFTRAATAELRHKTREMCQKALHAVSAGDTGDYSWLAPIVADATLRDQASTNLANFLSRFDEAHISTIHGFCQRVLRRAGLASPTPTDFTISDSIDDVIDRVVTDRLAARLSVDPSAFSADPSDSPRPPVSLSEISSIVTTMRAAVRCLLANPAAIVVPDGVGPHLHHLIADFATDLVDEVRRWCAENDVLSHDDLVRLAAETLATRDDSGTYVPSSARLATEMSRQYRLVMVDEFQDTDEMQWRIFESIHHHGSDIGHTLITVGDAKQAIYRFRGADVGVYMRAESSATQRFRLSTNRRSNPDLLAALEVLFLADSTDSGSGFPFDGSGAARFVPVKPDTSKNGVFGLDASTNPPAEFSTAPVEVRWIASDPRLHGSRGVNLAPATESAIYADIATKVIELLRHGTLPDRNRSENGDSATRRVTPADIAILVDVHADADNVMSALRAAQIPAVQLKTGSVFSTEAAFHFRMLLDAAAQPQRLRKVKAAAVSLFGNHTPETLLAASDDDISALQAQIAEDSDLVRERGVTALYMRYRTDPSFLDRVLSRPDGERVLTDLDHIAEILASHPTLAGRTSAPEVASVLIDLMDAKHENEERKRRIETDDAAVVVMTMHLSKGLQFPIVILPNLISSGARSDHPLVFTHDLGGGPRRVVDIVSGFKSAKEWTLTRGDTADPTIGTAAKRAAVEQKEADFERRRLMYVALTRAEHKVITYWSATTAYPATGYQRPWPSLLEWGSPTPTGKKARALDDAHLAATFAALSARSDGRIALTTVDLDAPPAGPWVGTSHTDGSTESDLDHARFAPREATSLTVRGWRRWSYSGLTRILKGPDGTIAQHDAVHGADEVDPTAATPDDMQLAIELDEHHHDDAPPRSPLLAVSGGTALGTLIHEVFDEIDPSSPAVETEIATLVSDKLLLWPSGQRRSVTARAIVDGIITALDCPLGEMFDGRTLRDLGHRHRLSELRFDHLLGDEDTFTLGDMGALLAAEAGLHPAIAGFADTLRADAWAHSPIAGAMNGSIDAVFKVDVDDHSRFVVADYKSDRLHHDNAADPLAAYTPDRLAHAMTTRGYMLQALVYSVALHRFLRWRLGDTYDFTTHFGGVAYMFVRGMAGDTDQSGNPIGLWTWAPSLSLIDGLDRLFAGVSEQKAAK